MWESTRPLSATFVETHVFTKRIVRLGLEQPLRELQIELAANPKAGEMHDKLFAELLESANEALQHARGKRDLRTTVLPPPLQPMSAAAVQRLRKKLKVSQAVLAHYLNVSTKLVQAWESGRRKPDGPALLLLRLAARRPELLISSYQLAAGGTVSRGLSGTVAKRRSVAAKRK